MCNLYNTGTTTNVGCGCAGCNQRVCRDACGNLRVVTLNGCGLFSGFTGTANAARTTGCGCVSPCCQHCLYGNDGASGVGVANGATSGGFYCVTHCHQGGASATTTTAGNTGYCARQYDMANGRCGCSSCGREWIL